MRVKQACSTIQLFGTPLYTCGITCDRKGKHCGTTGAVVEQDEGGELRRGILAVFLQYRTCKR